MIDLSQLGATATAATPAGADATFGVYLPEINVAEGYEVRSGSFTRMTASIRPSRRATSHSALYQVPQAISGEPP